MLSLCAIGYRFSAAQADKSIIAYQRYQSFCGKQQLGPSENEPYVVGVLPLLNRIVFVKKNENKLLYFILSLLRSFKILKSSQRLIERVYSHWRHFERDSQAPRLLEQVWANLFPQERPKEARAVLAAVQGITDMRERLAETMEALQQERAFNRELSEDLEHNEYCLFRRQQQIAEMERLVATLRKSKEALKARLKLLQNQSKEDDSDKKLQHLLQSLVEFRDIIAEEESKIDALVKS